MQSPTPKKATPPPLSVFVITVLSLSSKGFKASCSLLVIVSGIILYVFSSLTLELSFVFILNYLELCDVGQIAKVIFKTLNSANVNDLLNKFMIVFHESV